MASGETPLVARTVTAAFSRKLSPLIRNSASSMPETAFLQSPIQITSLPADTLKYWIHIKSKKVSLSALILIKQLLTLQVSRTVLPLALGLERCNKGLKNWDQNNCMPTSLKIFERRMSYTFYEAGEELFNHCQYMCTPGQTQGPNSSCFFR